MRKGVKKMIYYDINIIINYAIFQENYRCGKEI